MIRPIAAIAAALIVAAPLCAQDSTQVPVIVRRSTSAPPAPGALTLQEAIARAQQHGHSAIAARATRDASRYRGAAFSSSLLPQLSLGGTVPAYNRSITQVVQPDGSQTFVPVQQTSANLSMSLSQRLPFTGGSLFVQSSLAQAHLTGSPERWSSSPLIIGLRQDIFRPNTLAWDRREQNVRSERDERAYLEAQEDIALQTTDLFFNVYAAREALRNAINNAATNDTLYRLNTGRLQVGRIGENDLLQSELALLRSRSSLEGAQLEFDRATAALRIQLGLPVGAPLDVAMTAAIPTIEVDTAKAVAEALHNRATVSEVALATVQGNRAVTEARLRNGVGAQVVASYGYNASTVGGGVNQAYQDLLQAQQFSVSVSLPLWQWGQHSENVRAAQADRDRLTAQSEASLDQLAQDAHFAALELGQARRTVALLATADSVAGKRFDVAYNRYVIGRITIDNLYIAQTEKDAALQQFVDGLRRYWQAHYRLRRVTLYDFEAGHPIR
jgi:outer membrane protein